MRYVDFVNGPIGRMLRGDVRPEDMELLDLLKAGNAVPCGFLALEHAAGGVFGKDPERALELAEKACCGSFTEGCMLHSGMLSDADACESLRHTADDRMQRVYDGQTVCGASPGIANDASKAKASETRACALGAKGACG